MILGMSVGVFTTLHVLISLVAILAGIVVLFAMIANQRLDLTTSVFLFTTILTSVTGFRWEERRVGKEC